MQDESLWISASPGKGTDMDKKNYILIGGIVALAILMLLLAPTLREKTDDDLVIVSVDGREYARIPLTQPQTLVVEQEDGRVNEIQISDHGARMLSSTCKNQKCVHMGEVNLDNWEYRADGAFIICLPNRVTVELAVKE